MQLAKVIGSVISTRKCDRLEGMKLLVAVPIDMDTFKENDLSASNINHQILNGVYRTVQMLEVIAYENLP